MLSDVDCGAAVFAAGGETLQHAQHDERDGRCDANGVVAGQKADEEGRRAHEDDGDDECVLAPDDVAEPTEYDGAERTHDEPGGEGEQGEDALLCFAVGGEELRANDRGERTVKIEVVPFEYGAGGRGDDDFAFLARQGAAPLGGCFDRHGVLVLPPPRWHRRNCAASRRSNNGTSVNYANARIVAVRVGALWSRRGCEA